MRLGNEYWLWVYTPSFNIMIHLWRRKSDHYVRMKVTPCMAPTWSSNIRIVTYPRRGKNDHYVRVKGSPSEKKKLVDKRRWEEIARRIESIKKAGNNMDLIKRHIIEGIKYCWQFTKRKRQEKDKLRDALDKALQKVVIENIKNGKFSVDLSIDKTDGHVEIYQTLHISDNSIDKGTEVEVYIDPDDGYYFSGRVPVFLESKEDVLGLMKGRLRDIIENAGGLVRGRSLMSFMIGTENVYAGIERYEVGDILFIYAKGIRMTVPLGTREADRMFQKLISIAKTKDKEKLIKIAEEIKERYTKGVLRETMEERIERARNTRDVVSLENVATCANVGIALRIYMDRNVRRLFVRVWDMTFTSIMDNDREKEMLERIAISIAEDTWKLTNDYRKGRISLRDLMTISRRKAMKALMWAGQWIYVLGCDVVNAYNAITGRRRRSKTIALELVEKGIPIRLRLLKGETWIITEEFSLSSVLSFFSLI